MNKELNVSADFIKSQIVINRINDCIVTTVVNGDIVSLSFDVYAYNRVMMDIPSRSRRYGYTYKQAVYQLLNQSQISRLRYLSNNLNK